jgi:hypothetical protein
MPASLPRKHRRVSAWCVESIYTSVSARYVVRCLEWQRVTDQIDAAAVSLCNTETGDLCVADSSSRNAVSFSSARRTNASRHRDARVGGEDSPATIHA